MKKILISLFMITMLLVGCKKKEEKIIKFEYFSDSYIEKKVDEKELLLTTYDDYKKLTFKYNLEQELSESDFKNNSYIVVFDENDCSSEKEINKINYSDKTLEIEYMTHNICGLCMLHTDVYYYKINKITDKVNIKTKTIKGKDEECDPDVTYKPILYLYPDQDMFVSVKIENKNNIITSYPKYDNGWYVLVSSDGIIHYQDREYYALYWDEYNSTEVDFSEGFYVNKSDALSFLEEKLDYIGLTNREANEFIMYWLPVLEQNEHSLVYFELTDEREKNNKLNINPEPDSLLRINMHIKKVSGYTNIKEQELERFTRNGFTVVEWGGTIHKEGNNAR